jgi:hypothetical protein
MAKLWRILEFSKSTMVACPCVRTGIEITTRMTADHQCCEDQVGLLFDLVERDNVDVSTNSMSVFGCRYIAADPETFARLHQGRQRVSFVPIAVHSQKIALHSRRCLVCCWRSS